MMAQLMQSQKDTGTVPPDGGTAGIVPSQSKMGSSSARHQMSGKGANGTAQLPQDQTPQKCPRCDSLNTKFCYYNNYSTSQPRHFCKNCRRYWTRGGALRNVPVGGGCRKNKRVKQRLDPAAALAVAQLGGGAGAGAPPSHMDIAGGGHRSVDGVNMIPGGLSMMHGLFSPLNVLNMQAPPNSLLSPAAPPITASSLFSELAHMKENGIGRFLPAGFPSAPPFLGSSGVNVMIPSSTGAAGPPSLFAPPLVDRVASPPNLLSAAAAGFDHLPPPPPPFSSSASSSSSLMQPPAPNLTSLYSGGSPPELSPFSLYDSHPAAPPPPPCSGTLVDHLSGFNGSGSALIRDHHDQVDVDQADGAQGIGRKNKLMGDESDDPWQRPSTGMSMSSPADHVSNNFFLQLPSPAAGSLWNWPEMHTAGTTAAGGILH